MQGQILSGVVMIDGVILAGGQSLRMGRDKAGLVVGGKTLLQHQIDLMRPEVGQLFVAGNIPVQVGLPCGVTPVGDFLPGQEGPLSGALAALQAASAGFLWLMPCDSFGFTPALKARLLQALCESGADIAYVEHGGDVHPLLAMWRTQVKDDLLCYVQAGGRSVLKWYATRHAVAVPCELKPGQCCNMNTPEDFQALVDGL